MAVAQFLRASGASQMDGSPAANSTSLSLSTALRFPLRASGLPRRSSKVGGGKCEFGGESKERAVKVVAADASVATDQKMREEKDTVDLVEILVGVGAMKTSLKARSWKPKVEKIIEKDIFDFRFFTLIAVAGSFMGSILCFAEGFCKIIKLSIGYVGDLCRRPAQEVFHLMEAIDMFVVGTAILLFGMALYRLFISSHQLKERHQKHPIWVEVESVAQMKTKIGQAVVMIMHVDVLEKFQSVVISDPFDLICFAGAILVCSACVFLLSRLATQTTKPKR